MGVNKPLLSSYPHLHNILRNDPRANEQFNALISKLKLSVAHADPKDKQLANAEEVLKTLTEQLREAQVSLISVYRFVRAFGDVVESQFNLEPFTSEIRDDKKYFIELSPEHIRKLMSLYWEFLGKELERQIVNRDP